nr:astacin-like metalloprotease toxin 5 isoform X3 [Parasteatoda tepidariorum]
MLTILLISFFSLAWTTPVPFDPMMNEGLYDGDMAGVELDENRNANPRDSQKWPDGVVPYIISPELSFFTSEIKRAMQYIQMYTCIRFVERTNQHDYVKLFKGNGCWSYWGKIGREQLLSLGDGCHWFGTTTHELLHAVGFEHEHNRSDRDDYLNIHWENIEEKWYYAFKKLAPHENRILGPFDFGSIMMYGSNAFAKKQGQYSFTDKKGGYVNDKRDTMSWGDVNKIKKLYNC